MSQRLEAKPVTDKFAALLARYAELRDQGTGPYDAARELGRGMDSAQRYERWYRRVRGLPPRERWLPGQGTP
jgi:hypothetical protein